MRFVRVAYAELNARQKENRNYLKVASKLADYGYNSLRISDDWQGADFIAYHVSGSDFLKVQLKGRLTISAKYQAKDIHIAFMAGDACFVYPHDEIMDAVVATGKITDTAAWKNTKAYDWPSIPKWAREFLKPYSI